MSVSVQCGGSSAVNLACIISMCIGATLCLTFGQGPKLRLPGRQCNLKFSPGDQNLIVGRQLATCKVSCYCGL